MKRVLFVCMGNICRSPAAEIVFHEMLHKSGLADAVGVDSAGTIGYHTGHPPDHRMVTALKRRGYRAFGKARKVSIEDLDAFDLVLAMDEENLAYLRRLSKEDAHMAKIQPFVVYLRKMSAERVPDPYYGGSDGFEHVIDLLEDGCSGLLEEIRRGSPEAL